MGGVPYQPSHPLKGGSTCFRSGEILTRTSQSRIKLSKQSAKRDRWTNPDKSKRDHTVNTQGQKCRCFDTRRRKKRLRCWVGGGELQRAIESQEKNGIDHQNNYDAQTVTVAQKRALASKPGFCCHKTVTCPRGSQRYTATTSFAKAVLKVHSTGHFLGLQIVLEFDFSANRNGPGLQSWSN